MAATAKGTTNWSVETLYVHFTTLLQEQKEHYEDLLAAAEAKNQQQFRDAKEAIQIAQIASQSAINKSEANDSKWRDNSNEWRQAMDDREVKFMPRMEYSSAHQSLIDRISMLENRVTKYESTGMGLKQGWGFLVGAAGLVLVLLSIFMALKR